MDELRTRTSDGRQIVTVSTGYSYAAPRGHELAVGDKVYVPAPYWLLSAPPQVVEVISIGTKYQGDLVDCWT